MPLQPTGQITLGNIRSEFGQTGQISLSSYKRGGGFVAAHQANESIPSTNSNILVSNFYGAEDKFTAAITSGFYADPISPPIGSGTRYIYKGFTTFVITSPNTLGSLSRNRVGKSKSNTTQAIIQDLFQETTETYVNGELIDSVYTLYLYFTTSQSSNSTWWTNLALSGLGDINRTSMTFSGSNFWYATLGGDFWDTDYAGTITITL